MSFIAGLHGTVAAILICSLLFVDETGVPLPFAPGEVLLLLIGVLIAGDAFPPYIILPVVYLAMAGGMVVGYAWARAVGQSGLQSVIDRVGAGKVYERAQRRLSAASPVGIGLARMIPGLRPYATLVSGAAQVELRTFLLGALPALLAWELILVVAGILVGLPVAHLLGRFEKVALRGVVLVVLGIVAWFAVRDVTAHQANGLGRIAPRLRPVLALLLDAGIVLGVVGGLFAIGRRVLHTGKAGWAELLTAAVVLIALLVFGRHHQTPGETLFDTEYWHHVHAAKSTAA